MSKKEAARLAKERLALSHWAALTKARVLELRLIGLKESADLLHAAAYSIEDSVASI